MTPRQCPGCKTRYSPSTKSCWCEYRKFTDTRLNETGDKNLVGSGTVLLPTCKHEKLNQWGVCLKCGTPTDVVLCATTP